MWALQDPDFKPFAWYKFGSIFADDELEKIEKIKNNQREKLGHGVVANNTLDRSIRRSKVSFIDIDEDSDWLYRKMAGMVNDVNQFNYNFTLDSIYPLQYGLYDSKDEGFYNWHPDANIQGNRYKLIRKLSFSILMSKKTDFEGGELLFNFGVPNNDKLETVELDQYDVVFFPSFYAHKVDTVTKGVRESIVGWIAGPVWQ